MSKYLVNKLELRRSYIKIAFIAVMALSMVMINLPSNSKTVAPPPPFDQWLQSLKAEAISNGVRKIIVDQALDGVRPLPRIIELDRSQPEFTLTLGSYFSKAITPKRIAKGQEMLEKHKALLRQVYEKFGVQPRFIVAFWGLESNFGQYTGVFPVVNALVTLSYDRRRSSFFREQLLAVLQLIDKGHFPVNVKGSWAGAMGNHQFIPTTYRDFAVDFDGDGKIDLWNSLPDIFASAANYLARAGWQRDQTWGREVRLSGPFDVALTGLQIQKSLREWDSLGVRRVDGRKLPNVMIDGASLLLPAGYKGPKFLVYQNYRTTMIWNRSRLYAFAVGHLSDRLLGKAAIQADLGDIHPLARSKVIEIQEKLNKAGFEAGEPDGRVGPITRRAIRRYQARHGLPPDGFPNSQLINHLNAK